MYVVSPEQSFQTPELKCFSMRFTRGEPQEFFHFVAIRYANGTVAVGQVGEFLATVETALSRSWGRVVFRQLVFAWGAIPHAHHATFDSVTEVLVAVEPWVVAPPEPPLQQTGQRRLSMR